MFAFTKIHIENCFLACLPLQKVIRKIATQHVSLYNNHFENRYSACLPLQKFILKIASQHVCLYKKSFLKSLRTMFSFTKINFENRFSACLLLQKNHFENRFSACFPLQKVILKIASQHVCLYSI